jgi:3-oxoacyl-[acyl-carrier protein] reductase
MNELAGKTVLVTGGSSGIGAACVSAFAGAGARVLVGFNTGAERAAELLSSLPGKGHAALPVALEDEGSHEALRQRVQEHGASLDILVNSAGFTQRVAHSDLDAMEPARFNRILLANVGGTYSITRALLPLLQASPEGLVVNISSVSAFTGSGSNIAYCAAKAALDNLTMSLARAFGPAVRFLSVSPASVDTGFVAGRNREELLNKAQLTPLGRLITPQDVARAVLACATHLKTATGTRLVIDGGHSL